MVETIEQGRDAVRRHAWAEAMEAFAGADRDGGLAPSDLELLGEAAWWAGQPDQATDALERAFAGRAEAGEVEEAARVAFILAYQAFRRQAGPVGAGWLAQAQRLLDGRPESAAHAWLAFFGAIGLLGQDRFGEALESVDRAIEIAQRHGALDVQYLAMSFKGHGQLVGGDWRAGQALVDEAAAAAASGRLDMRVASDIYCNTIAACRNVGDLERAARWAEEGERWMRRNGLGGYPGVCRVHRAELKMLRGQWPEAEREALQACDELEQYRIMDAVGFAYYEVGEVRLRRGDLAGAGEAFDRAYEYGHESQPGLALLDLARGEIDSATRSIGRALASHPVTDGLTDRATRARLLPAQVDIALAAGDLETARGAVDELESIAATFERPLFEAGALTARGELLLGEERASEASPVLGRSWRLWQASDLPYESALARLRYAEAVAAEGDDAAARRDLRAVRNVFERLGAARDLRRVDELLGEDGSTTTGPATRTTRTLMFTDIVTSTDLIGLIGDEAWAELLGWHDRELRSAFGQHRGEEVKHTGDGFFVAFEQAIDGLDCAVDIQRRLARHRRDHGFAPQVRIGLHAAEASRQAAGDYSGKGVHVAARVGAAAAAEEILVTEDVVGQLDRARFALSDSRPLTVKGVREPIEVRTVSWR